MMNKIQFTMEWGKKRVIANNPSKHKGLRALSFY